MYSLLGLLVCVFWGVGCWWLYGADIVNSQGDEKGGRVS